MHVFDNNELNFEEYARPKAQQHTKVVSTICPQITPVSSIDFSQANATRKARFEGLVAEMTAERGGPMRASVTQVGVSFNMRKNAIPESQFVIRVSDQHK